MPYEFVLPDLGEGMTEAEIRKWLVKEGDFIKEHQVVLEVETDKAVVEVPSPVDGKVLRLNKNEGEVAKVGELLMFIAIEGDMEVADFSKDVTGSVSVVGILPEEEEVLATPSVRALAREHGVRLEDITGSGPGGSITKEDVLEASKKIREIKDQYGPVERLPIRGLRKTISKNLLQSQKMTAFVTGMDEADITDLWTLREREKKTFTERGIHLTFMPFFIKAVQHSLIEYPLLNASVDEEKEEIIIKKYFNIGIAVDTPDGLMVPVIKNVDKKSILELAVELQELSQKAKERRIKIEEIKGSTFTITNYGHFGGTFATPIINYPDVAILGTGRISDRPWIKDGQIAIRKILPLSLTFDHRVTDGVYSAKFLSKIIQYLEDPALLFIEST